MFKNNKNNRKNTKQHVAPIKRECYFCTHPEADVDYKNHQLLQKFLSSYLKILPSKRTGACSAHQRRVSEAIKRARIMALLPFVPR